VRRPRKATVITTVLATIGGIGAVAGLAVAGVLATAPAALALDNGLALTPPMGSNNWNTTQCRSTFNETMIRGIADTFVSAGLKDAGYQYINLDDCWAETSRDSSGHLVPSRTRFPSGIKALADYVHGKGLKLGIYTSAGTHTCNVAGFPGALNHEQTDANTFASWDVDYLKYDNCNNQGVDAVTRYTKMRDALKNTGRPIVYSICEWGKNQPWNWGPSVGNLWRTSGDISDNWSRMVGRIHANDTHASAAGPGHWNDPDMLEVGNGGMSATEYRTHFSMWAIMAAPLLIGSDIRNASATTLSILTNSDVIAVDQDPLGRQGTILAHSGSTYVYRKPLANGDVLVALFNETSSPATITTTAAAAGLSADAGPGAGTGRITYADGTTQQFALSVPDWYSNPPSGSDPAITMTYRNRSGNTQQAHAINVFLVKVPLQEGKTPSGVTLPDVSSTVTSGVPAMHVFGIAIGD